MREERQQLIAALKEFAQFLEDNPNAPTPTLPRFDVFCITKEEFQLAAKTVGGHLQKHNYDSYMTLRRNFGPLQYDLNVERERVCERVVTGTKYVPETFIPSHNEDIVEWRCHPIMEVSDAAK